jgi:hypothetical protein
LKEQQKRLVAPFLLDGAIVADGRRPANPNNWQLQHLDEIVPLLKFKCTIVAESEVDPNTTAAVILAAHRNATLAAGPGRQEKTTAPFQHNVAPKTIRTRRKRVMAQNFPVTLARFRKRERLAEMPAELSRVGVEMWQVQQAACNLVLSKKLSPDRPHYGGLSSKDFVAQISEIVQELVETADGSDDLSWISEHDLLEQVFLDGTALLKWLGFKEKPTSIEALQHQLRRRGFLEGDSAS